jgi:hypothetical protein
MKLHALKCLALAAVVLVAPGAMAGYKQVNTPNPKDEMAVSIYQLDNGLTVYLTENHDTPRFYAEIAVRAGSKHDPAESTGLAHYLEHLLFKGSENMGTLDFAQERVHIEKIEALYQQHFNETDPEKRKALYAEINAESVKAAEFAVPKRGTKKRSTKSNCPPIGLLSGRRLKWSAFPVPSSASSKPNWKPSTKR